MKHKCPEHLKEIVDLRIRIHSGKGYHKIQKEIKDIYGKSVSTCGIADRKRSLGYPMRTTEKRR